MTFRLRGSATPPKTRKHSRLARSLLATALSCGLTTAALAGSAGTTPPVSGPVLHTLSSAHVPAPVASAQVPRVANVPGTQHLKLALSLPPRNQAELNDLLQQLQDPNSPNYHHYLSVQEFTERFGPTQADYDQVVSWAREKGLNVTEMPANRRLVDVEGTVDAVNQAFHVSMGAYSRPADSSQFFAPDREPSVDLAVPLLHIDGLDNYARPFKHSRQGDLQQVSKALTKASGSGPSGEYLPSDIRAAYYGNGSLTGAGQSIGIFSYDGYKSNDVTLFYSNTGMSSSVPITNVLVNGYSGVCDAGDGTGTSTCDDGEQILDIVNAIGMAPGISRVYFYEGSSATDILNKMVSDNSAKSLSCSWGGGDFNNVSDDPIYQEMAAQGQTFANATGDDGAYNSQTWAAPSADSNTLEVGGTDLTTTGPGGAWSSETGWANSGGGYISSAGESTPSYQKLAGVITTTNKASSTYRNDPDVAAEANFDNPTVSNGTFQTGYGGTSFAAPRWAGIIALANQQSVANGHGTVGFVNPALYNIGVSSAYTTDFHDITSGNNKPSKGSGSGFNATTGYDLVTGWGSPTAALIAALAGGSTATADFSLSASPTSLSVAQGSNGSSTITINKLNGFSSNVSLSASGLPSGVTAAFGTNPASSSSSLTLSASSSAATGNATVTITGTSGSLTHTTTIALTVTATATADFSLSASPNSLSVAQGASGSSTVTVNKLNGFSGSVTLAASGLPSGVTAAFGTNPATSTSTLTLTASSSATVGNATVTITGTSGSLSHSTTVALSVTSSGGTSTQLLGNTGFESTASWTASSGVICATGCSGETAHAGVGFAWMDGYGSAHTDTVAQTVTIPSGVTTGTLQFYLHIDTAETTTTSAYDTLTVQVGSTTVATFSNLNKASGYQVHSYNVSVTPGASVKILFTGKEDASLQTSFVLDDVTFSVH